MLRILLLVLFGAVIFFGMAIPFAVPGWPGKALSVAMIVGGSAILYYVENRTAKRLDEPGAWNDFVSRGDEFLYRQPDRDLPAPRWRPRKPGK